MRVCTGREGAVGTRGGHLCGAGMPRESPVWAMAVVVPGIAPKDALKMACIDDEKVIEALRSDGPDEPLRVGVRVRRPEWGSQDLGTFGPEDLVEARHVLRVSIVDKELDIDPLVDDVAGYVPRLLGDPVRIGMGGDASDPDPSAADLDEEQDVEPVQHHRVHAEEVGGHDVGRLGSHELSPRGARATWRWSQVVVVEDPGNGAGGQPDAELHELALDAPIAPSGVLLARRTTRAVVSSSTLGRPGERCG